MKKIRHVSQLDQIVDRSLAWRKKELTGLKFVVDTAIENEHAVLCRAGVTLLYAHWEGFVKEAANAYLRLVAGQDLSLSKLTFNFIAINMAGEIVTAGQSRRTSIHSVLIERITNRLEEQKFSRWRGVVHTRSNLKAAVFREIIGSLNFDLSAYTAGMNLAIDRLVSLRNAVAHGQYLSVLPGDYDELYKNILQIVEQFRDQIGDAAATQGYLRRI